TETPNSSLNLSEAKRKLLEKYLRGDVATDAITPVAFSSQTQRALVRIPQDEKRELSLAQARLWFLDQLMPGSAVFNVPMAARIHANLDLRSLRQSIAEIVRRHEVLRTTFTRVDDEPVTIVSPVVDIDLPLIDLSCFEEDERETRARALI